MRAKGILMRISVGGASKSPSVRFRSAKGHYGHLDRSRTLAYATSPGALTFREKSQSFGTQYVNGFPTANSEFETEHGNVSAEAEAAYNVLISALNDANFAVQRVLMTYDASLAHLRECRFESSAAHEILAQSNRTADAAYSSSFQES